MVNRAATRSARGLAVVVILTAACSPPSAQPAPPVVATPTLAPAPPSAPPAPPPTVASAAITPSRVTTVWETELARGTEHEVRSIARAGDAIWATGWYGDPTFRGDDAVLPLRRGNYDPFLARLSEGGAITWQGRLEGALGAGVARATDGELLVAGELVGEIPGALLPKSPLLHAFVGKLGVASHRTLWIGGPNTMDIEHAWGVAAAPDGGAYLASELHAVARLAGEPSSKGREDILVSRFDAQGKRLWRTPIATPDADWPFSIATAPNGDVVVAGVVGAPGAYSDSTAIRSQGLVARLSPEGAVRWERRFGGAGVNFAGAVAVDAGGRLFVVAVVSGDVTFGGVAYHAEGYHDVIVASLDGDGDASWVKRVATTRSPRTDSRFYGGRFVLLGGGAEPQYNPRFGNGLVPTSIAVAPGGALAVGGWFVDELRIGEETLGAAQTENGLVVSLGDDGAVRWVATPPGHVNAVIAEDGAVIAAAGRKVTKLALR